MGKSLDSWFDLKANIIMDFKCISRYMRVVKIQIFPGKYASDPLASSRFTEGLDGGLQISVDS